jgi:hypothetical protein
MNPEVTYRQQLEDRWSEESIQFAARMVLEQLPIREYADIQSYESARIEQLKHSRNIVDILEMLTESITSRGKRISWVKTLRMIYNVSLIEAANKIPEQIITYADAVIDRGLDEDDISALML